MTFSYLRTVRLSDTDAAGVVYFTNVLAMCHEAYEESLETAGIDLKVFVNNPTTAIPIIHGSVDFFRPMFCGDKLIIHLTPQQLNDREFEVTYQIVTAASLETGLAKAKTRHVCIHPTDRHRMKLPEKILQWLKDKR
jgi:1,4-dihydroxy-2-naphthoyl-CoA hydrolase